MVSFLVLAAALAAAASAGCKGSAAQSAGGRQRLPDGGWTGPGGGGYGTVQGALAAAAAGSTSGALASRGSALSLDHVTVELVSLGGQSGQQPATLPDGGPNPNAGQPQNQGQQPSGNPNAGTVYQTATPAADGTFTFANVPAGRYTLQVQQPEFASVAYSVDSTDFDLGGGETVSLVLPLLTKISVGAAFGDLARTASSTPTSTRARARST